MVPKWVPNRWEIGSKWVTHKSEMANELKKVLNAWQMVDNWLANGWQMEGK